MQSTSIPSLYDMCITMLQNNIDDLPTLESIENDIIIRILSNCEPYKLDEIEKKNEEDHVILQTDELWKRLIVKDFGGKRFYLIQVVVTNMVVMIVYSRTCFKSK